MPPLRAGAFLCKVDVKFLLPYNIHRNEVEIVEDET